MAFHLFVNFVYLWTTNVLQFISNRHCLIFSSVLLIGVKNIWSFFFRIVKVKKPNTALLKKQKDAWGGYVLLGISYLSVLTHNGWQCSKKTKRKKRGVGRLFQYIFVTLVKKCHPCFSVVILKCVESKSHGETMTEDHNV